MSIDFSKFGEMAESVREKVSRALKNDNKVSENEIKQMMLSKELESALREELSKNPGVYEDAFVVTQNDDKAKYTLKLDKNKSEGPLTLTKDSMDYYKKNYPNADITGAYFKNGVVYLKNKFGEQAIDDNGAPIKYSFAKQKQEGSVDLLSYYLNHNGGQFDLNKFNTISAIQARINSTPEVSESYAELMNSIEFEQADDEGKTRMLFEQAKSNLASSSGLGEIMQNLFTSVMLNCQVLDNDLKITDFREYFNKFYGLDKIANAMRNFADDNNDENLSALERVVSETIGTVKGAEAFVTSTQLLAFIGMLGAASICSEGVGLGEVFAIASTGFFGYEAGSMGIEGFLDGIKAKTPEEAEAAGEQLGAAALMMLGVAKGARKVLDNFVDNHSIRDTSEEFGFLKEQLEKAGSREELIRVSQYIKKIEFDPAQRLELNKIFFKKTVEIQSNYTEIQKSIVNMHKGEITPAIAERNNAIRDIIQTAIDNHKSLTLKEIADRIEGASLSDVRNSVYNKKFGLKDLFDEMKANGREAKSAESEVAAPTEQSEVISDTGLAGDYLMAMGRRLREQNLDAECMNEFNKGFWECPTFADKLLSSKNQQGISRMSGVKNSEQISKMFDLYRKNPELAEKLFFESDSKGNFRYTAEQIEAILKVAENNPEFVETAKLNPEFVSSLLEIKNNDGSPFYSAEDIKILVDESTRVPGFVKILVNQKNADGNPRFTAAQIRDVINLFYKEPEVAQQLLYSKNEKGMFKYTAECVEVVVQTFESGTGVKKALARKLLNENPSVYPDGVIPESPSEFIISELTKVVKRGRPKKTDEASTPATEEVRNGDNSAGGKTEVSPAEEVAPSAPVETPEGQYAVTVANKGTYEFKNPYYNTSTGDLRAEAEGTSKILFEAAEKRIFSLIKNLPARANINEPIVYTVGNNHLGFTIKKTIDNRTVVTVKNWLGDKASWDKRAYVEESLNFELDEFGQMTSANLSWNNYYESKYKTEYSYTFSRNAEGNGVLTYKEASYGGKTRFKNATEPYETTTRVYEQSSEDSSVWYPKEELDQARSANSYEFNLSEGSLEMVDEAFSYSREESSLKNLLLNLAKNENSVPADRKAAFRMSEAQSEESGEGTRAGQSGVTPAVPKVKVEIENNTIKIRQADAPETPPAQKPVVTIKPAEPKAETAETEVKTETEQQAEVEEDVPMTEKEQAQYERAREAEKLVKIPQKIKNYIDRLPENSKMKHSVNIDGTRFMVEKKDGKANVTLFDYSGELKFVVNENGQMERATLYSGNNTYVYTRDKRGIRRLIFNGVEYQPDGKSQGMWTPVLGRLHRDAQRFVYAKEDNTLLKLMMNLGETKTKVE